MSSPRLAMLANRWRRLKVLRDELMAEARQRVEDSVASEKAAIVDEVRELVRSRAAKKIRIAEAMGVSRSTLDNLLKEHEKSGLMRTYSFSRHDMRNNILLVGVLPESGGFPELAGEVALRVYLGMGEPKIMEVPEPVAEFVQTRHGAEAVEWALREGVIHATDPEWAGSEWLPGAQAQDAGGTAPW